VDEERPCLRLRAGNGRADPGIHATVAGASRAYEQAGATK
jgi:hypothetical protein